MPLYTPVYLPDPFIPMVETEGQKVFLPLWVQGGNLLQFDPETQWASLLLGSILAKFPFNAFIYTSLSSGLTAADIYWSNVKKVQFTLQILKISVLENLLFSNLFITNST